MNSLEVSMDGAKEEAGVYLKGSRDVVKVLANRKISS